MAIKWDAKMVMEHARELRTPFEKNVPIEKNVPNNGNKRELMERLLKQGEGRRLTLRRGAESGMPQSPNKRRRIPRIPKS